MKISWLIGANPRLTLIRGSVLVGLTVLVFFVWLRIGQAQGISMEPNYRDGSWYVIHRLHYTFTEPARGDVVAVPMLGSWRYFKLKRILGLPGETLSFDNGQLLIDGEAFDEPWIEETGVWSMPPLLLGSDDYFVAGDNRLIPFESNWKDHVPRTKLYGKVFP